VVSRKKISTLAITNTTSYRIPRKLLQDAFSLAAKKHIMEVSLVFLSNAKMRTLNATYRGKDYSPNVLAFPLDEHGGEICINPMVAKREAKECGCTLRMRFVQLFVHGLLHLQGKDHQNTKDAEEMEREEDSIVRSVIPTV